MRVLCPIVVAGSVLVLAGSDASATARPRPQLGVSVNTSRAEFLLGEPVIVVVKVTNRSGEALEQQKLIVEDYESDIAVFIAGPADEDFHRHTIKRDTTASTFRSQETLKAGEIRYYTLRILYTTERPSRLAFEQSGFYRIKVSYPSYPVMTNKREEPVEFESNTVPVRINPPKGEDSKAWEMLRDPEVLYLLQTGLLRGASRDPLRKALDVHRAMPVSTYSPALKWCLQQHYEEHQRRTSKRRPDEYPELEEIRRALGMPVEGWGPFLEDRRLDVKLTCDFGNRLALEDALKRISERSGVPLRIADELRGRTLSGHVADETLRTFMQHRERPDAAWVRQRDGGYRLVPVVTPK